MNQRVGFESLNDECFQSQLKAKYKSKIFIGTFVEKRLSESLKSYRDCVQIDTKSEKEFAKDLENLLAELSAHLRGQVFVGITKYDENFTLWTELDEAVPFGSYWFQVSIDIVTHQWFYQISIFR